MFKQLSTISNLSQLSRVDIKGDTELQTLGYIFQFFFTQVFGYIVPFFHPYKCKILICKVDMAVNPFIAELKASPHTEQC